MIIIPIGNFLQTNEPSKAGELLQPYEIVGVLENRCEVQTFDAEDGSPLTVIFEGMNAEERAKEYIDFQNQRNEE